MSFLIILLTITFGRSNSTLLGYEFLNTDEFVIGAKALRLVKNNFNLYEFDGDTSGLLNALFLTWPKIFDFDVSYLSIRITSILIISLILYFTYKIITANLKKKLGLILFLPLVLFFAFSKDPDFIHYTNELIATLLIMISIYLITSNEKVLKLKNFLISFILGSVLFAKMQFFPVAIIIFSTLILNEFYQSKNFKQILLLSLCFCAPLTLISLYYFFNQNFIDLFYNVIHYPLSDLVSRNLNTDQIIADTNSISAIKNSNKFQIIIDHLLVNSVFHLIYFYLLILIFLLFCLKDLKLIIKGINFELLLISISIISTLIISLITGSVHRHYLIVLLPMIPIFMSIFIKSYYGNSQLNKNFEKFSAILLVFFIISIIFENSKFYSKKFIPVNFKKDNINFQNPKILDFLKLNKNESIIVWGWKPELYILSNFSPAARDTVNQKQIDYKSNRNYFRKRFISDFINNDPSLLVDYVKPNSYMFTSENQNVKNFPELIKILDSDFKKINLATNNCPDLYLRNDKAEIFNKKNLNYSFQNINKELNKLNDLGIDEETCETSVSFNDTHPDKISVKIDKKKIEEIMILASKKNINKAEIKLTINFVDNKTKNYKFILKKYPFWSKLKIDESNDISSIDFNIIDLKKNFFGINELKIFKK